MTIRPQTLIAEVLAANGYELIEAEYFAARGLWRVFIDRPESRRGVDLVNLDDCSKVSDLLQDELIAADVPYEHLEVSSPGMDRALTKPVHFERFAGDIIKLTLEPAVSGIRKFTGLLVGLEDDNVIVEADGQPLRIPYSNVARARVVPQY